MAYPNSASTFTRVTNYKDLVLETQINPIYVDLENLEADLIGNNTGGVGLRTSYLISGGSGGAGTFTQGTATWTGGLQSRLNNMDIGLYTVYNDRVASLGLGAINTAAANIATTPLAIRGAGSSSTITGASTDGTTVTYVGANSFVSGQTVTISGIVSSKAYTGFTGTTGAFSSTSSSPFTITGTHGINAAALPSTASIVINAATPVTVTGTLSYISSIALSFVSTAKKIGYIATVSATSSGTLLTMATADTTNIGDGMTMVILTGTGTLNGVTTVTVASGTTVTMSATPTVALTSGTVVMFYWAAKTTTITLTGLLNLSNVTLASATSTGFTVTNSNAPSGTTWTSGGTAISKTNAAGLTDWKTYDGTTVTTVATVDTAGTFVGSISGGSASSTYNN